MISQSPYKVENRSSCYLRYMSDKGMSFNTVQNNAIAIVFYLNYLFNTGMSPEEIIDLSVVEQEIHFRKYLEFLKMGYHSKSQKKIRNETCNTYLEAVFRFYAFSFRAEDGSFCILKVLEERQVQILIGEGTSLKRKALTFPAKLGKDEERDRHWADLDLINMMIRKASNIRDKVLLVLLRDTGVRIGELLGVRFADIDFSKREIKIVARDNNINGAKNKYEENRTVKFSTEAALYMEQYMAEYATDLCATRYFLIKIKGQNKGEPLNNASVNQIFVRISKKMNANVTSHHLRHLFATRLYRLTGNLNLVRVSMGHKNIATTIRYIQPDLNKLAEAHDKLHDLYSEGMDYEDVLVS